MGKVLCLRISERLAKARGSVEDDPERVGLGSFFSDVCDPNSSAQGYLLSAVFWSTSNDTPELC